MTNLCFILVIYTVQCLLYAHIYLIKDIKSFNLMCIFSVFKFIFALLQ